MGYYSDVIDKEIIELKDTRSRIDKKIKTLSEARKILQPICSAYLAPIAEEIGLDTTLTLEDISKPARRAGPEQAPRKFLKQEYMGLCVVAAVREVVVFMKCDFTERDISRKIFSYRVGIDEGRCHQNCCAALNTMANKGELLRVSLGIYRVISMVV